mmetsp:Transcript_14166/g.30913  ORF Transcript_14166/g.30913 Transcript_14166/m.30913 type:complete len:241 (+) Transcript_14166:573-1295(+)
MEGNQKSQFVNHHVLEHTFGIALKAFSQRFGCVFVGIVGHVGDHGSLHSVGEFTSLAHIFAHILVVSHENFHTGGFGFLGHGFQFGNCGRSRLFQVDAFGAVGNGFVQKTWVIGGTSTDQSKTRGQRRRQFFQRGGEFGAVGSFGFGLPDGKVLSGRRILSSSHEPGFDNVIQRGGGALLVKHLNGVVPSHTAVGGSTSDQDDFGLAFFGKSKRRRGNSSCGDASTAHKGGRSSSKHGGE